MRSEDFLKKVSREFLQKQQEEGKQTTAKRQKLGMLAKLDKLREYIKSGQELEMYADYGDVETGDLLHRDKQGIVYIMTADEIRKLFDGYNVRMNSYLLGSSFNVKVTRIDENGDVYVTPVSSSLTMAQLMEYSRRSVKGTETTSSEQLGFVLRENLSKTGIARFVVRCTVLRVEQTRIFVDIFDTGLIGVVPAKNYRYRYTSDLRDHVEPGDVLKGVVIAHRAKEGENEKHFIVATADFLSVPWKNIIQTFKVGSVIVVKCTEKKWTSNQRYFWGASRMLPNVDIMCDYTASVGVDVVKEGHYYKCKIVDVSAEKEHVKVAPFAECAPFEIETKSE